MEDHLVYGLILGICVGCFIFFALNRAFINSKNRDYANRKALAIGSFGLGAAVAWWFYKHPDEVEQVMSGIAAKAILIIIAVLASALLYWKIRSLWS